eukprot:131934-Pyramimonas_sp.AAC.1
MPSPARTIYARMRVNITLPAHLAVEVVAVSSLALLPHHCEGVPPSLVHQVKVHLRGPGIAAPPTEKELINNHATLISASVASSSLIPIAFQTVRKQSTRGAHNDTHNSRPSLHGHIEATA